MDVVAEDCDLLEQVVQQEKVAQLRRALRSCLTEQEREVICLRYGLEGYALTTPTVWPKISRQ